MFIADFHTIFDHAMRHGFAHYRDHVARAAWQSPHRYCAVVVEAARSGCADHLAALLPIRQDASVLDGMEEKHKWRSNMILRTDTMMKDALLAAVDGGHVDCVVVLVHGCAAQKTIGEALVRAAEHGHTECVAVLVDKALSEHKDRALQEAARNGHIDIVLALLPGSDACANESLAVRMAAQHGHAECVRALIGVSGNTHKYTWALQVAAYEGHTECVRLLLPYSDPKANDSAALLVAARGGHDDIVDLLWEVSDGNVVLAQIQHHPKDRLSPHFAYLRSKMDADVLRATLQNDLLADAARAGRKNHKI